MTFIASVIARDGIAVIADSLVSSVESSLDKSDFVRLIEEKSKKSENGNITLSPDDVFGLFKTRTSYTRDYAEKLFKFDKYTAITVAGAAYLNSREIKEIIDDLTGIKRKVKFLKIDEIIELFKNKLLEELTHHFKTNDRVKTIVFIFSHWNIENKKGELHKITVEKHEAVKNTTFNYANLIKYEKPPFKIICDGQDKISNNLLFGILKTQYPNLIFQTCERIFKELSIDEKKQTEIITKIMTDKGILDSIFKGYEIFKIRELSLQEATDLACLLMAVVRDFQKYTEDMPTVGGQIKVVNISSTEGFKFLEGNKVVPKFI